MDVGRAFMVAHWWRRCIIQANVIARATTGDHKGPPHVHSTSLAPTDDYPLKSVIIIISPYGVHHCRNIH